MASDQKKQPGQDKDEWDAHMAGRGYKSIGIRVVDGAAMPPPMVVPPRVFPGTVNLDDDTPLVGGACDLGGDCEACQ